MAYVRIAVFLTHMSQFVNHKASEILGAGALVEPAGRDVDGVANCESSSPVPVPVPPKDLLRIEHDNNLAVR